MHNAYISFNFTRSVSASTQKTTNSRIECVSQGMFQLSIVVVDYNGSFFLSWWIYSNFKNWLAYILFVCILYSFLYLFEACERIQWILSTWSNNNKINVLTILFGTGKMAEPKEDILMKIFFPDMCIYVPVYFAVKLQGFSVQLVPELEFWVFPTSLFFRSRTNTFTTFTWPM